MIAVIEVRYLEHWWEHSRKAVLDDVEEVPHIFKGDGSWVDILATFQQQKMYIDVHSQLNILTHLVSCTLQAPIA